jgi:hypothetical protein
MPKIPFLQSGIFISKFQKVPDISYVIRDEILESHVASRQMSLNLGSSCGQYDSNQSRAAKWIPGEAILCPFAVCRLPQP